MKWKILTVILAVVAVGAIATTIVVTKGYRINKAPDTQISTAAESLAAITPTAGPGGKTTTGTKTVTRTETKTEYTAKQVANTKVTTMTIPAGTNLGIALVSAVSTSNASVGDAVQATTTEALMVDGVELAPVGSAVAGKVTDVLAASRNKSAVAHLDLVFTSLATVGGSESINGLLLGGEKKAGSSTVKDAAIIVGSGVGGAVLGKIIGKTGKSTAIGGVIGAAAGMGVAAMQKGREVSLPAGTKLTIVLDNPVQVALKR
jgi:hypothetical protein